MPKGSIQRIAFGSCAKQWQAQPIWDAIINEAPDLWLFLGDNIYADTDGRTAWAVSKEQLQGEWNRLADKPEFQRAASTFPMMATWDNHDYGSHSGGAEFALKADSREVFLSFFSEPKSSLRWKRSGIYDSKIFGHGARSVQVILLDTKYNRSPFRVNPASKEVWLKSGKVGKYLADATPEKTHLGREQWEWLETELRKPATVRLICSSTQIIPNEKGMDEWGNFPLERQRFFDLINNTNANGVIILSGNVHYTEISKMTEGVRYPIYEFTSSGMTHTNNLYANASNTYRIAGPSVDLNFGLVTVDWQSMSIELEAINEHAERLFIKRLDISSLSRPRN